MDEYDIVMLYSGGADSRLMIEMALRAGKNPYCILIDYGQKHIEELDFAIVQLKALDVKNQIIKVSGLNIQSGLTGDLIEGRWETVNEMNVPGRNTIFIALAISVAENKGINEVWYGADYSDRINLFPDCYQEYVVKMNELLAICGVQPIKLVAPLLGMTKELIYEILGQYGIEEDDMYSGYEEPKIQSTEVGC